MFFTTKKEEIKYVMAETITPYKPVNLCLTCENGYSRKTVSDDYTYHRTYCFIFKREWAEDYYVIELPVVECSRYHMIQSK